MTREETWKRLVDLGIVYGETSAEEWELRGVDLSGVDLRGADFDRSDLSGANLSGADLSGAYLGEVDLSGANLLESNLCDADLSFANLNNADLRGCKLKGAHTDGISLHGANLSGLDLRGGYLISKEDIILNANLSGVNLSRENLSGCNLSNANFTDADLSGGELWEADFTNSNLTNVDLRNANLHKATLAKVKLNRSKLNGIDLTDADLSGADLEGVDLTGAKLSLANLTGANLSAGNLSGVDLRRTDLSIANLSGANLLRANLTGANLREANLTGANLREANLFGVTFLDAKLINSTLEGSKIKNVNFNNANLSGADITGATFWGVSTTGWKIEGIKADHVYFTRDLDNKEIYKRIFKEGQFEALFKSLPTIELIFEGGLSFPELWTLNVIIEEIRSQNPEFGLKLTNASVGDFQTTIGIRTAKDEFLEKATFLILNKLEEAVKGIPIQEVLQHFVKLLPVSEKNTSITEPYSGQHLIVNQDIRNMTINFVHGNGSIIQSSPYAKIEYINIINNYRDNEETIGRLFNKLKNALHELGESSAVAIGKSTDELIGVLREGKDIGRAQKIWNEIKEGIKTAGSAAGIVSALIKLLEM